MVENTQTGSDGARRDMFDFVGGWIKSMNKAIGNRYFFAAVFVLVILLAIFLRTGMLKYQGLFEPDGFYYYSVIKEAVNNNFVVQGYAALSGFPTPNTRGEQPGLVYLTLLPYMILQYLGISYLAIMRLLPVLFGVLYVVLAYFFARQLSNSRLLGILAMFFVAVSSGNIARTAALVYRGDSFIALPLLVALLLMLKALKDDKHRMAYVLLASVALSTGILIWTGAAFIVAVYMFALMLLVGYGFVTGRKDFVETCAMLAVGLFITYALEHLYVYIGAARLVSPLYDMDFFVFYLPLLIASLAVVYLIRNKHRFAIVGSAHNRTVVMLAVLLVAAAIAFFPLTSYIVRIVEGTGAGNNANNPVGATTQELQAPTFNFLFASFNMQLYLAPVGVLLFILMLLISQRFQSVWKFFGGGNRHITLSMGSGFIVASLYLAVTAYMQSLVIRYNALLSIPLAIFAAYCLYAIWEFVKDTTIKSRLLIVAAAGVVDAVLLYFAMIRASSGELGSSLFLQAAGSTLVIAAFACAIIYSIYAVLKGRMRIKYMFIAIAAAVLIFNFYNTYLASAGAAQADGINPLFLNAMTWMSQNTPKNATAWAVWPDGSVIEGWGNRTSYMDSVGGEYAARIVDSSDFLFNSSAETQYLYSIGKPQYLVARSFWYSELGGLAVEGLVQNASQYGYVALSTLQVTHNDTAQFYSFGSDAYKAMLVIKPQQNGTSSVSAFIGSAGNNNYAQIRYVMLYNQGNYNYSIVYNSTATLNYTLMVTYVNRTITGSVILGVKLPSSNLFKFTFLCNYYVCPYGDSNVTMKAVYINSDTRIFKIDYR